MGDWNDMNNWVEGVIPNNTALTQYEVVINDATTNPEGPFIGADKTIIINKLTISENDSFVEIRDGGSLKIKNEGTDGLDSAGTVKVVAGGLFELNGGSIKSYRIELIGEANQTTKKAILRLNSDTTLDAPTSGASIVGSDGDDTSGVPGGTPSPQDPDGEIDGDGKLTLGSSAKITGELVIRTDLVNNGLVDANDDEGKIFLTGHTKSGGTGSDFKATAGLLQVNIQVTGSADWTSSGKGFLFVAPGGDISGTDLDVLKVGDDSGGLRVKGPVTLAGNLDVTSEFGGITMWLWTESCKFTGGDASDPNDFVTMELIAKDVYACPPGTPCCDDDPCTCWDAAWPCLAGGLSKVIVGTGAHVKQVDDHDNGNRDGPHCLEPECFMVPFLEFEDTTDGKYNRNGIDTHFLTTNAGSGQLTGDVDCGPDCQ